MKWDINAYFSKDHYKLITGIVEGFERNKGQELPFVLRIRRVEKLSADETSKLIEIIPGIYMDIDLWDPAGVLKLQIEIFIEEAGI